MALAILISALHVVPLAILSFLCVFVYSILRPLWTYLYDPLNLRRFPAPTFLAAVTPLWCLHHSRAGNRFLAIHEAHLKLGDIIRISSNHISINDPAAIKEIYGHVNGSKIMKGEFYENLAGEYHNIANVRDREDHARKRKYYSNAFALKSIIELEPMIARYVDVLLKKLDVASLEPAANSVNINRWLNFFTFDVIGEVAVGKPFSFMNRGSDAFQGQAKKGPADRWHLVPSTIDTLHSAFRFKVALGQLSKFWYDIWLYLLWWTPGKRDSDMFTSVAISQVRRRLEEGRPEEHSDFFARVLMNRDGKPTNLPFMELVSEAIVLLNAGSDTTSSSLTSAVYEIARNPTVKARLREELNEALDPDTPVPFFDAVKSLPYLRACLDENLRLTPPIPYGPPRLVIDPEGVWIAGHHFRAGTTISIPTYTIQRRADLFPDPSEFKPERWLDVSDEALKADMQQSFLAFSTGPRSCLGRNLAMMEQQVVIASLFHRYNIELERDDFVPQHVEAFNLDPGPLPVRISRTSYSTEKFIY